MKDYKVRFLEDAVNDLEEIVLYISTDSIGRAVKWRDNILEIATKLSSFPFMGAVVQDKKISRLGYRMIPVNNYTIFYKVYEEADEVVILRVLSGAKDYPSLFS